MHRLTLRDHVSLRIDFRFPDESVRFDSALLRRKSLLDELRRDLYASVRSDDDSGIDVLPFRI